MKKIIIALFLVASMILPAMGVCANDLLETRYVCSGNIYISGRAPVELAGKEVSLVVKNKSTTTIENESVRFIDQIKIGTDGYFKFEGVVSDGPGNEYDIVLNYNGQKIQSNVDTAYKITDVYSFRFGATEKDDIATAYVTIKKEIEKAVSNITSGKLIFAAYNENGKLINAVTKDVESLSNTHKVSLNIKDMDDLSFYKVFLWENLLELRPITESFERKHNQDITFWGDSITRGTGGEVFIDYVDDKEYYAEEKVVRYPSVVEKMAGGSNNITIHNLAIGGETATTIAARQGGVKFMVANDAELGGNEGASTQIALKAENSIEVLPILRTNNPELDGVNPCIINGIKGNLSYVSGESGTVGQYYFTRLEAGEDTVLKDGDIITTAAMRERRSDAVVLCVGQNGGYGDSVYGLIKIIDNMLAYLDYKDKQYVIVGVPHMNSSDEKIMAQYYGEHFISLHSYLVNQALADAKDNLALAGINAPTAEDLNRISRDMVPTSLLKCANNLNNDVTHFNAIGNQLIGKLVYEKLCELNIIEP